MTPLRCALSGAGAATTATTAPLLLLPLLLLLDPAQGQGTNLGGSIVTRTDVETWADLSLDVAEIETLLNSNQIEEAIGVFKSGENSEKTPGVKRSLASLGDDLASADPKTPEFLYHLYGRTDKSTNFAFVIDDAATYINEVIEETLTTNAADGADAILAVGMWMYATHLLYNGVYECERRTQAENPDLFDIGGAGFDEFIALWIGKGQQPGSRSGSSLYTMAQAFGEFFGTSNPEAVSNTRLKIIYQQASSALSVSGACTRDNPGTAPALWTLAVQAVSEMSKVLFQGLILSLSLSEAKAARVYAQALVPQFSKCQHSVYVRLKQLLIDQEIVTDASTVQGIMDDLAKLFPCFGFPCSELGQLESGLQPTCPPDEEAPVLAGFIPTTPVGSVSRVDLDIHQIRVLTALNSLTFARYIYLYGSNVAKVRAGDEPVEYVSLHAIAVSSERSSAQPWFNRFIEYHNEKDYADKAVQAAFAGRSKWVATQQRSLYISLVLSFQIILMEAVTKLRIAVEQCKASDPQVGVVATLNPIDEAAALIIGSMEGIELGGSTDKEDGMLLYNRANRHAFQFGTINRFDYAASVSAIEDFLFAAKAELASLDCLNLEKSVDSIQNALLVGIFQGAIAAAKQNHGLGAASTALSIAEGEALSLAVLPIIKTENPEAASKIEVNMIRRDSVEPVENGPQAVADAFGQAFTFVLGFQCAELGSIPSLDPCATVPQNVGSDLSSSASSLMTGALSSSRVALTMVTAGMITLVFSC